MRPPAGELPRVDAPATSESLRRRSAVPCSLRRDQAESLALGLVSSATLRPFRSLTRTPDYSKSVGMRISRPPGPGLSDSADTLAALVTGHSDNYGQVGAGHCYAPASATVPVPVTVTVTGPATAGGPGQLAT